LLNRTGFHQALRKPAKTRDFLSISLDRNSVLSLPIRRELTRSLHNLLHKAGAAAVSVRLQECQPCRRDVTHNDTRPCLSCSCWNDLRESGGRSMLRVTRYLRKLNDRCVEAKDP
jgi:hypothetical protein